MTQNIIEVIVELMRCESCKDYLRPPISYLHGGSNICAACATNTTVLGANTILDKIGKFFKFLCRFKKHGYSTLVSWEEAEQHENDCPLRQFSCPSCCWKGSAASMKSHVRTDHSMLIYKELQKFILQNDTKKYFVIDMEELYVLIYKCDSGIVWITLKAVGPLACASRRHFQIILKLNDKAEYSQRKQVEAGINWEIDEVSAIKIDTSVLRTKLQMKNETVLMLYIKVFSRTPLYNGSVDEGLLNDITCPVCNDHMYLPIFQCSVGHSFCNYCKPKLKSCPTCRGSMTTSRNFILESICNKMYFKCMYADDGCSFASLPAEIKQHESKCDWALHDCPFKTFIPDCEWRGELHKMGSHTLEEHGIKF